MHGKVIEYNIKKTNSYGYTNLRVEKLNEKKKKNYNAYLRQ